tara:strand:- start:133 stop:240 length:108 start_codon:yes stop_codon:yes gene_type:complete
VQQSLTVVEVEVEVSQLLQMELVDPVVVVLVPHQE